MLIFYVFCRKNGVIMIEFKNYFRDVNVVEMEQGLSTKVVEPDKSEVSKYGYSHYLGCFINNLHQLQKQNRELIGEKDGIKKSVLFCDYTLTVFLKDKKVNYRYWKAHLKKVGTALRYCNNDLTSYEIKNSLFKVFQRNIHIPKGVLFDGYYLLLGIELDEIVEHCIMNSPKQKALKTVNKILFNPSKEFTGKQRRAITGNLARRKILKKAT